MNYELEFTEESVTDLEKLTQVIQIRIINKINWLAENFEHLTPQPLTGDLANFYKLRVGDYSVSQSGEVHISKPHPQPLSLLRRGEIKHSFIGVRSSCTSVAVGTLYRVLYTFSNEPNIIIIHQIGHRREIYK